MTFKGGSVNDRPSEPPTGILEQQKMTDKSKTHQSKQNQNPPIGWRQTRMSMRMRMSVLHKATIPLLF
jgi:hypothetical protein